MLLNLHVKNYAIIEDINIDFNEGLNIISGETGSGKSLLLNTLSLLKGERFNKEYIGSFDDKTVIEAVFSSNDNINELLSENDIELDDNIIITRIFKNNSSITKINNSACNIKLLSKVSNFLFDIHGQHSQLVILDKKNYINLIDKFDDSTIVLKKQINNNIKEIEKLKDYNEQLNMSDDEIEREKDLLNYQINEIESFDFENYNEIELNKEYKKLSNQAELITGITNISNLISESSRTLSFKEYANNIYNELLELSKLDEDLKEVVSDSLNIRELIFDLSKCINNYYYTLEVDDERIQIIEDTFSKLQVLKLKYGKSVDEILYFLNECKNRYKLICNINEKRDNIIKEINKLNKLNLNHANQLTKLRKNIIEKLEVKIISELKEMNMQHINFKIDVTKLDKIKSNGQDDIDFLISTNKGQDLKSLSLVSSGGEISRFMLALKAAFIEKDDINTLVFDEIDTGISGKTANIVGEKLKKISNSIQLIVISHLPQIASKANNNYLIFKTMDEYITKTHISNLDYNGKVNEIARLISGENITDSSIKSAKELIKE